MKVLFDGQTFDCVKAVKKTDTATLYLLNGCIVEFSGISDWTAFSIEGGEWSIPELSPDERISILEEQLAQSDETAIALYEAQEAQETINAQQDEALMEIYEMIG